MKYLQQNVIVNIANKKALFIASLFGMFFSATTVSAMDQEQSNSELKMENNELEKSNSELEIANNRLIIMDNDTDNVNVVIEKNKRKNDEISSDSNFFMNPQVEKKDKENRKKRKVQQDFSIAEDRFDSVMQNQECPIEKPNPNKLNQAATDLAQLLNFDELSTSTLDFSLSLFNALSVNEEKKDK